MYIEASAPRVAGDTARLRSKVYQPTNNKCLSFWYSMNGLDMGTLNVYVSQYNRLGKPTWTMSGNKGNGWKKATVTIQSQEKYQV